jgi:hypothetical protein
MPASRAFGSGVGLGGLVVLGSEVAMSLMPQ